MRAELGLAKTEDDDCAICMERELTPRSFEVLRYLTDKKRLSRIVVSRAADMNFVRVS